MAVPTSSTTLPTTTASAATPSRVEIGVLGAFSLRIDGRPAALALSAQRVVSFLALHEGTLLRRHVAGMLWSDTTERHASGSLRSALWRLGRPEARIVEANGPHLRLAPAVGVDIHASEAAAHEILSGVCDPTRFDLCERLLSADVLPDWTEDWVLLKREYHTQLRLRALEALCGMMTSLGRHGEAVQAGILAVAGEPLRESANRVLIKAHLADGNTAAATRQFSFFRDLLNEQLQLEPSNDMQSLLGDQAR